MKYFLFLIFLCIVACSAVRNYISVEEKVYYEKCSGCHHPHDKDEHNAREWYLIMEKMSKKARLNGDENRMIIKYLTEQTTKQ